MADVRDAPAPFNNPRADIILRTCDSVDYRVRSSILAEASCVFEDMFDIARDAPAQQCPRKGGVPVVALTETSEVTDLLLRLCYPVPAPKFTTFAQVRDVLVAVDKYMMEGLLETMKTHLTDFALEGAHPLLVFITAYAYRFEDVARVAAQRTIGQPLRDIWFPGLEDVTAGAYCRLLQFHEAGDGSALPGAPFLATDVPKAAARPPLVSYSRDEWESQSTVPYPFGTSSADLALRSCDGIEFRVHSDLLQIASPYLRIMMTTGSTPMEGWERNKDGRVTAITLPEHSRTLATMLQYVYPVERSAVPSNAYAVSIALKAAKRYQVAVALAPLEAAFLAFAETEPLVVYAIACAHHWVREARHAALMALRKSLRNCYVEELEWISATHYFRLLAHRDTLGTQAESFVLGHIDSFKEDPLWRPTGQKEPFVWASCRGCKADSAPLVFYNPFGPRKWWCDWLREVAPLLRGIPAGETVLDQQAFVAAAKAANACRTCGPVAVIHLHRFAQILSTRVNDELARQIVTLFDG